MADMTPEGKLLNIIRQAQGKLRLKKDLKVFTKINLLLIFIAAVILIIFFIDIFLFRRDITEFNNIEIPKGIDILLTESVNAREWPDEDLTESQPEVKEAGIDPERVRGLVLLGIVKGDNEQAIIRDVKTDSTFFLYKGDSFSDFVLFDIKGNTAVLTYNGEKIELNM